MKIEIITKQVNLKNGGKFIKYFAKTVSGLMECHFKMNSGTLPTAHSIIECDIKDFNIKKTFYKDKDGNNRDKNVMWVSKFTVASDSDETVAKIEAKRKEQAENEAIMLLQNTDLD